MTAMASDAIVPVVAGTMATALSRRPVVVVGAPVLPRTRATLGPLGSLHGISWLCPVVDVYKFAVGRATVAYGLAIPPS